MKIHILLFSICLYFVSSSFSQSAVKLQKVKEFQLENDGEKKEPMKGRFLVGTYYQNLYLFDDAGNKMSKDTFTGMMLSVFKNSAAVVTKNVLQEEKWGIIGRDGATIIPFEYDFINHLVYDHAVGMKGDELFILGIDSSVVKAHGDWVEGDFLMPGVIGARKVEDGHYTLLDLNGKRISKTNEFEQIYPKKDSTIKYQLGEISKGTLKNGLVNHKGKIVVKPRSGWIYQYPNYVQLNNSKTDKVTILDTRGKIILPPRYKEISNFENYDGIEGRFAIFKKGDKEGLLDKEFKVVLEPKYKKLSKTFLDQYYAFSSGDYDTDIWNTKYGLIDFMGNIIFEEKYRDFKVFSDNDFLLDEKESCSWVDRKGEKHHPVLLKSRREVGRILPLNGIEDLKILPAIPKEEINYRLFKKGGGFLTDHEFTSVYYYHKEKAIIGKIDSKYMLLNDSGKELLPPVFDEIKEIALSWRGADSPVLSIKKDNLFGIADYAGNILVEPQYTRQALAFSKKHIWFLESDRVTIYEIK